MTRGAKVGIVVAGYALAFVAGGVAAWVYNLSVSALPYDTSGGMYAGGELITSVGAFLAVAVVTTGIGLWFARRSAAVWNTIPALALAFAGIGLIVALRPLPRAGGAVSPLFVPAELLRLAQLLGMPLWTVAFAVFAWIAPTRPARRQLVAAIAIELVIGAWNAIHWLLHRPLG